MTPKPPPVPPKDFHLKDKTATAAWTTAKSSPTLVSGQSPEARVSPRAAMSQNVHGLRVQRSRSVRDALGRIGTRLSPLPTTEHMRDDITSPCEQSPRSGASHTIHVKMDLGLNKFVNGVVGRCPPSSLAMESPLDPTWPRAGGIRHGLSVWSSGAVSSNARSSRSSSVPTLPERTPTWSQGVGTPTTRPV
jgi:hypothetical protein